MRSEELCTFARRRLNWRTDENPGEENRLSKGTPYTDGDKCTNLVNGSFTRKGWGFYVRAEKRPVTKRRDYAYLLNTLQRSRKCVAAETISIESDRPRCDIRENHGLQRERERTSVFKNYRTNYLINICGEIFNFYWSASREPLSETVSSNIEKWHFPPGDVYLAGSPSHITRTSIEETSRERIARACDSRSILFRYRVHS